MSFFTVQAPRNGTNPIQNRPNANATTLAPATSSSPQQQHHHAALRNHQYNNHAMMMMPPPNTPTTTLPPQAGLYPYITGSTPMSMPSAMAMQQAANFVNNMPSMHALLPNRNGTSAGMNGAVMAGNQQQHHQQRKCSIVPTTGPPDAFKPHPASAKSTAEQRAPGWARKPLVAIPEFNHSTIQTVLDINKQLIKILIDYQNYGWFQEQEFKMYQARLQSNIAYLVAAQDFLDCRATPTNLATPDLSPVVIPIRLQKNQGKQASNPATVNKSMKPDTVSNINGAAPASTNISTEAILASINPPAMVRDPNPTNQLNPSTYTPVQPFVLPHSRDSRFPIPPHLNPLPTVSAAEASEELTKRMVKGLSTLPSEQRSLRTVKDDQDSLNDVEKKNESHGGSSVVVDEGGDDDTQDEDYVPGADEYESADDTAAEYETDRDVAMATFLQPPPPPRQQRSNKIPNPSTVESRAIPGPVRSNISLEPMSEIDFNSPGPEGLTGNGSSMMPFEDDVSLDAGSKDDIMMDVSNGANNEFGVGLELDDIFGQGL
ncbi:hypothetical protein SeMB42_g04695 [Synchytrium endobioticum]|uniref:SS18 N-terminal domain-containing protein n=1 Tax=Synchytrium endobioticum TaxID=286115 RepID=A0A507CWK3_9FUNG|nr:hypothetical protein SeMB42_g04695 [Synchytrium endobioticum]TPX44379.1 hypothetical protein SeLEV6574_g04532 [Synchytrium endobioticum]